MIEKINLGDVIEGTLSVNKSGSAYLVSDKIKKDIYVHKKNTSKGLHLDTVKIEIFKGRDRKLEGKVIEVVKRFKDTFVGTIEISKNFAFVVPDSPKMVVDIFIPIEQISDAKDGQKVVVELTKWGGKRNNPNGKVIQVLGNAGENDTEIHSILHEYGLPYKFDEDVEAEANMIPLEITEEEIGKRRDMRDILTFTIDPDTAKDFDDALSVEYVGENVQVGIHIADVSHYVRPGTELDKEAYERGTSVYLVDRVVPMLPENLSNGLCSLRPLEDKLCFSAIFTLDTNGNIIDEWFGRTVINSDHRFTYEEAQVIIENDSDTIDITNFDMGDLANSKMREAKFLWEVIRAVKTLDKVAKKMRAVRHKEGSISFDKREIKFILDEDNKPVDVSFKTLKDSNKLIEEFMLLANKRVAKFLNEKKITSVNRSHGQPDIVKLQNLKNYIGTLGYSLNIGENDNIRESINKLLLEVKGTSEENIVNNLVIRSMQKAEYSTKNIGHYGLGFMDYSHFTSPIRRYPDVMIHRILNRVLQGYSPYKEEKVSTKCKHLSNKEVTAQKASRDSIKYKQCEYMEGNVGRVYDGVVVSVQNYGLFIEISETNCEGFVSLGEISGDSYQADVDNFCVVGYNTGEKIRLGDEVTVVIKSVDVEKKTIDLSLLKL